MPKNRVIYFGILILVASALLWLGAQLTKRIEWMLPYAAGIGLLMVIAGVVYEARNGFGKKPEDDATRNGS